MSRRNLASWRHLIRETRYQDVGCFIFVSKFWHWDWRYATKLALPIIYLFFANDKVSRWRRVPLRVFLLSYCLSSVLQSATILIGRDRSHGWQILMLSMVKSNNPIMIKYSSKIRFKTYWLRNSYVILGWIVLLGQPFALFRADRSMCQAWVLKLFLIISVFFPFPVSSNFSN